MEVAIRRALEHILAGKAITRDAAEALLPDIPAHLLDIMAVASIAASGSGPQPLACGIVNARSGLCHEKCVFCAQSLHHRTAAPVHPLISGDALLYAAEGFAAQGVCHMGVVASGGAPDAGDFEKICRIAERIAAAVDIRLCASLGCIDFEQARSLKAAGFTRYHHNLETARSHFSNVCPDQKYERRMRTVRHAGRAGLQTCCGGLFGIGETWKQRLELSQTLAELAVDSIPVNFLIPVPGTPLAGMPPPPPQDALAIIALLRLMHPGADIIICGGRAESLGRYDSLIFSAGANGLMVGDYLTVNGLPMAGDRELMRVLGMERR